MYSNKNTKPTAKSGGRRLRNDIIFITVLLLTVAAAGLGFFFFRGEGDLVNVTVDGELFGSYPLDTDMTLEIRTGKDGENVNVLVIEGGKARVATANCPDGICSSHRDIFRDGESIVCLPHRVVVTVDSSSDAATPDIVS